MEINLKGLTQEQLDYLKRQIAEQEELNKKPKNEIDYENGWVIDFNENSLLFKSFLCNNYDASYIDTCYSVGLYRPTKEECEKLLKKLQIHERLRRWSLMCEEKIDWYNEKQWKYYLFLDMKNKEINIGRACLLIINNNIYFTDRLILERAIEDIGEQNLIDNYFEEV